MIDIALRCENDLGESPIWCWRTKQLYWTDIRAGRIHVLSPETRATHVIETPDYVAAIGLHRDGGLILGMKTQIAHLDTATETLKVLTEVEPALLGNRGNDGRVDRSGRFWFGTMSNTNRTPVGSLYLFDGKSIIKKRDAIIVPNALCWSPDGDTMYFADSWAGGIEVIPNYQDSDDITGAQLIQKDALPGVPDGAIVDSAGYIWNARYGGGCVARISPSGEVVEVVQLPVSNVTSCALGGMDLRSLFITSATQRMSEAERAAEPEAGSLFVVRVDVPGLPEPEFVPAD